jgi:hypothetical protein
MRRSVALVIAVLLGVFVAPPATYAGPPQDVKNVDEPGRNPWRQTKQTQVNTGDCHKGFCIVIFGDIPKGKRLVVTYASALFDGSTALGVGLVDVSLSDSVPGISGAVIAQVPGLSGAGKSGHYQAGGAMTFYVDQERSPVMVLDGASGTVRVTVIGYLVDLP